MIRTNRKLLIGAAGVGLLAAAMLWLAFNREPRGNARYLHVDQKRPARNPVPCAERYAREAALMSDEATFLCALLPSHCDVPRAMPGAFPGVCGAYCDVIIAAFLLRDHVAFPV